MLLCGVFVGVGSVSGWVLTRPNPVQPKPESPVSVGASKQPSEAHPVAAPPARPSTAAPSPSTADVPPSLSSREAEQQSGVNVVRPPGATTAPGTFLAVPQADTVALPAAPDDRLVERGRYGPLPRRGPDGSKSIEVYGRPVGSLAPLPSDAPRISLFVGGMGLNGALTTDAARLLPPAVTLGFAPYGGDLGQQVAAARALGHETVLQVPMESFNAPDASPMPHILSVGDTPRETLENLRWQMSRFVGYAGVASFLGGKFLGDAAALSPVLKEVGSRGLFYFDDGTAARSLAATIGPQVGAPTLKADVVIDALADPADVDASLRKLEDLARAKGVAIGSTAGLPTIVDHLASFTRDLPSRGVALVPLSALATGAR